MRTTPAAPTIVLLVVASLGIGAPRPQQQTTPACTAIIVQALKDYAHIKVGVTRSEVEKYFVRAGGAQFPDETRYDYPKCPLIHVDVFFAVTGSVGHFFLASDKVTRVSKLYLGYQIRD